MTRKHAERQDAIDRLRGWIKPGDTVCTILDNVSRSGMSRAIRCVIPTPSKSKGSIDFLHPNSAIGHVLGLRHWKRNGQEQDALVVGGCGMDMGFHLVNSLSQALYGGVHCDCGAWLLDGDTKRYTQAEYNAREGGGRVSDGWTFHYDPSCKSCKGSGYLRTSGYKCLGKGKCPSNYHVNYRRTVPCEGVNGRRCWTPSAYSSRFPVPADWPEGEGITVEGVTVSRTLLACLTSEDDTKREVCPNCKGAGSFPNPDGPERFNLVHTDRYAIRHRWL